MHLLVDAKPDLAMKFYVLIEVDAPMQPASQHSITGEIFAFTQRLAQMHSSIKPRVAAVTFNSELVVVRADELLRLQAKANKKKKAT